LPLALPSPAAFAWSSLSLACTAMRSETSRHAHASQCFGVQLLPRKQSRASSVGLSVPRRHRSEP
jgi:hypothetical protein